MITGDPRVRRLRQFGEDLYIPNVAAWHDILRDGVLDGYPVPSPRLVAGWLAEYGPFPAAALSVRKLKHGPEQWWLLPLLDMGGSLLRVHFEDVICEHCDRRCGPSATPDAVQYAGTGLSHGAVWAEFKPFPVQHCPHCGGVLTRRQTLWLAAVGGAT